MGRGQLRGVTSLQHAPRPGTCRTAEPDSRAENRFRPWLGHQSEKLMKPIHIATPLWESPALSASMGALVLLKMEALQPIGSFKARGIGAACQASPEAGARSLVCASGGNAGYAVAYAGHQIGIPVTVVVPKTKPAWLQSLIRREGATVSVHGDSWDA